MFFLDKVSKPETLNFILNSSGYKNDYAVGAFIIGKDANKREFYADSGTVVITEIHNYSVQAKFNFWATEKNSSNQIVIKNGVIDIK